jgi:hypothetical protein
MAAPAYLEHNGRASLSSRLKPEVGATVDISLVPRPPETMAVLAGSDPQDLASVQWIDDDGTSHLVPMHLGSGDRAKLGDLLDLMAPTVLTLVNTSTSMDVTNVYVPPPDVPQEVAHEVYASVAELAARTGQPIGQDDDLALALVTASRWVDRKLTGQAELTPVTSPVVLRVIPRDAGVHGATLVAAVRFLRSADAPFGVLGGLGDLAVRIYQDIPEAEMHLLGQRTSWGIA